MSQLRKISLLFLACLAHLTTINCQLDLSAFPLSGKSFSITSRVFSLQTNSDARLTEYYSIDQRRGKVIYSQRHKLFTNLDVEAEYTYDAVIDAGIEHNKFKQTCEKLSLDGLYDQIINKQSHFAELMNLAGADQDLKYMIGPARLLFLVASRANQLKPLSGPTDLPVKLRNIPVVMYSLDVNHSGGIVSTLYIFYDKHTHFIDSPRTSIPLQIAIDNPSFDLRIDYYHHEILNPVNKVHSRYRSEARLSVRNSGDETMDMFAFPKSLNCGKYLGESNHADLFEQYDLTAVRFSFRSDDLYLFDSPSNHFVAFDGMTYSMRIDHKRGSRSSDRPKSTMTLLDFRTNRKYITQDNAEQRSRLKEALGTSGSQCVITNIMTPDKKDPRRKLKLANFLLGASKFAYMGRAQVNGLSVRVYEATSNTWPFWLSQPMSYRDEKGYERRELHQPLRQNALNPTKEAYSVVVYVLDSSPEDLLTDGLRIIQLQVYDLLVSRISTHRMIARVRFHDFIWDLREAPNGDKAYELFSHIDLCSAGQGTDNEANKYAEVDLLLEQDEKSEAQNIDWMENWMFRDDALSASFRDVLNVQSMMMYDLESRFIKHDRGDKGVKRYVEASFRIAEHPLWLYHVSFMGNAHIQDVQSAFTITDAQSPIECLWLVDSSIKNMYIYYSESTGSCIIDLNLVKGGDDMDLDKSKVFKLNPRETGELYQIERRFDDEIRLANTWLRDGRSEHLVNRLMYLQHVQTDDLAHPIDPNELPVRIRDVKVTSVNFMRGLSADSQQIQPPANSFPGFGLVVSEESKEFVRRVGIRKSKICVDDESITKFTREQCQTECLADITCQAYSYCVRGTQEECLLSGLGFTEPGITEHLDSRDVQRLRQGSYVPVKIGEYDVQLVRDFRCELYNKIYMELFKRSWPSVTTLKGFQVFEVVNEEQCAKQCFDQSLVSILSSVALGNEIKKSLSSIEDANSISKDKLEDLRRKHRREMVQFCQYFMYLDSSISEQQEKILKRRIKNSSGLHGQKNSWYCIIDDGLLPDDADDDNEIEATYYRFTTFKFDFAKLFEKKYDFGLKESEFSQEEHDAYLALQRGEALESGRYELLKKTVVEGKNYQIELNVDENACAQHCFMQSSGLWPACRSFDMTRVAKYWRETIDYTCVLNTASYNTEKVVNEVNETKKSTTQLWHYEPRFKLAQEEVDNAYLLDEIIDREGPTRNRQLSVISSLGAFLVVILGIVSGLVAGLSLTRRFLESSRQENKMTIPSIVTPYQRHGEQFDD